MATPRQPLNQYDTEISQLTPQISEAEKNLAQFDNPSSYLNLLKNVAGASYNANADTIAFRQAARERLYGKGPIGYTPQNYLQMAPEQQATLKNAGRAGLVAGIQASQETEAARGSRIENLLSAEGARVQDVRQSLSSSLDRMTSRKNTLEQMSESNKSQSRAFFFDIVKNYPDLVDSLTPQEQNALFSGTQDQKLMDKVALYAKKSEEEGRIKTMEKNGYIIGYDPVTGKEIFRTDLGPQFRDRTGGGGGGGGGTERERFAQQMSALPMGFTGRLREKDKGVDFFAPVPEGLTYSPKNARLIDGVAVVPVSGVEWQNRLADMGINVDYRRAAQEYYGSQSPEDQPPGSATQQRLGTEENDINQYIAYARSSGATDAEIAQALREAGVQPKDFGIEE